MDRDKVDPRVQLVGKVDQVFRVVEQREDQHPEQADQDGHLDDQRAQAANGVDAALAVQPHGLLGNPLAVALVALLDFADPRLHGGHRAHLPQLLDGQRDGHHPHQHGERDDGDAHLGKAQHVQHQQGVEHRPDDHLVPDEDEYGEKFHLFLPVAAGQQLRVPNFGDIACCFPCRSTNGA